jgi:hypothetical protein
VATVLRSDTALAFYSAPDGTSGTTVATSVLGSYRVRPDLAPLIRLAFVENSPPSGGPRGAALVNPVVGATYLLNLSERVRMAAFLGVAIPVGMGGGNSPAPGVALAARSGILARSAMDNAMFAVNDLTLFPGVDLAWVYDGWTVQAEATLLQLTRVRGEAVQTDTSKTNFTSGLHVGRFLSPLVSLGAEVRYQRWLKPPASATTRAALDNFTFAVGPRFHFKLDKNIFLRPGLAYARGFDDPMAQQGYDIVQLDLPVLF